MSTLQTEPEHGEDRRAERRKRTNKQGQIVFRDGQCVLECAILELSATGAGLRPSDTLLCPNEFFLRMKFGPTRPCEVVWQPGAVLGVRFCD